METYSITVIIPTFNESENIHDIIQAVDTIFKKNSINGEILVVDDMSSDGTIEIVQKLQNDMRNVNLLVRTDNHGLSQSVVDGFNHAQSNIIQVIDADFSHPVDLIPLFYYAIHNEGYDICIGSRYTKGGEIHNWPVKRRIISLGATAFGRILFPEVTDPVSGFFAIKRTVVSESKLKPRGYKILMEILGKGNWKTFKEIPFMFKNREAGESKLKLSTITDYLQQCADIVFFSLTHHNTRVWEEWIKIIKFGLVGLSGIVVNTGLLFILTEWAHLYYMISSIFAIEASIITNFLLNDGWTFKSKTENTVLKKGKRFISYQIISILGTLINMGVLFLLADIAGIWYIAANLIGILVAFIWNFFVNRHTTWKSK